MINDIRLYAERNGNRFELDIDTNAAVSLNYQLNDIKDYGSRKSNFSKTIVLSSTQRNNIFFKNSQLISNVESIENGEIFPCFILANNVQVMSGTLELLTTNILDEYTTEYECCIIGGLNDFASLFGDELLFGNEDYSKDLSLGHGYTISNSFIANSFGATAGVAYVLPNTNNYNRFDYDVTPAVNPLTNVLMYSAAHVNLSPNKEVLPALNLYEVVDKLVAEKGYTWSSDIKNEDWFKSIWFISKKEYSETVNKNGFTYSVDPILHFKYTADTSRSTGGTTHEDVNGILFNDTSKSQANVSRVKTNNSMIISTSSVATAAFRGSSSDYEQINTLDNLKLRILTKNDNSYNYVRYPSIVYQRIDFDNNLLDKTTFGKDILSQRTDFQDTNENIVIDDDDAFDLTENLYTAQDNINANFQIDGYFVLKSRFIGATAGYEPSLISRTETKLHLRFITNIKQKDGYVQLDDSTYYYTDCIFPAITNADPVTNATTVAFSYRSDYINLESGDTIEVRLDSVDVDNQLKYTATNAVVPPVLETIVTSHVETVGTVSTTVYTSYDHIVELAYDEVFLKSINRFNRKGLISFNADQSIRVVGKLKLKSPYGTTTTDNNWTLKFVDVGSNGKYFKAFEDANILFEMPLTGNDFNEFDFCCDVEKGQNRYALIIQYNDTTNNNGNAKDIIVNIGAESEYRIYSIVGHSARINDINIYLPDATRKIDFIASVLKMFNLVLVADSQTRSIQLTSYDSFFNSNFTFKNWTSKLSLDSGITINNGSEYLANIYNIKYRDDDDNSLTIYKGKEGKDFGSYTVNNNLLLNESVDIENIFTLPMYYQPKYFLNKVSSTVSGMIIPDYSEGSNARIFFKNGVANINSTPQDYDVKLSQNVAGATLSSYNIGIDNTIYNYTTYPVCGHLYDLRNINTKNLSYSQIPSKYLPTTTNYTNTLFKDYYKSDLDNIRNAKLITGMFYLTENDINSFQYNDRIILEFNGTVYRCIINRISDYNPVTPSLTEVELLTF